MEGGQDEADTFVQEWLQPMLDNGFKERDKHLNFIEGKYPACDEGLDEDVEKELIGIFSEEPISQRLQELVLTATQRLNGLAPGGQEVLSSQTDTESSRLQNLIKKLDALRCQTCKHVFEGPDEPCGIPFCDKKSDGHSSIIELSNDGDNVLVGQYYSNKELQNFVYSEDYILGLNKNKSLKLQNQFDSIKKEIQDLKKAMSLKKD